ncbi:integrin alpha-4 isoform X1 [Syngnathus scovelli]|uniref:integrin alpha-4 isoform X1 n=1 Tax=Syngnathus scovelli TaxID=161590 RepID=UPI0021108512|nr:integrin alpha-4 isoform X1 [Syngnathus scovelli]
MIRNAVAAGLALAAALVLVPLPICGYTLDVDQATLFSGAPASMFGYSVLLHRHGKRSWLVAGAPVDNSSSSGSSPGGVYRCLIATDEQKCQPMPANVSHCGKTCRPESDHQWLGVSLSRAGGHVLACAHRWKNVFYSSVDGQNSKLPHGVCYRYDDKLSHAQAIIPCYRDHQRKFGYEYGSCQAGISNRLFQDLIIMGAPGTSYWTGSVLVYNTSGGGVSVYLDDDDAVGFGSYLGYSVDAGHFLDAVSLEVVGGAPQYNQRGKVFVFSMDGHMLRVLAHVSGTELGSYFGASLRAVDLNGDNLSDLLVGAPMTTGASREEGRVHVFLNQGQAKLVEADFQLSGGNAHAARFGEAIADLGDLDDDGYPEVAVGAPQEDDLKGAVYIYNGGNGGISPKPSQRISGAALGRDLRMFGQSLSSGVDVDDNGYQDVAVGAFLSDAAVVLRSRPVLRVTASLVLPENIQQRATAINVTVCFRVTSRHYKGAIDLQYNLTSDLLHLPSFPHRFYFHGNGSSNTTRAHVRVRLGQLGCTNHVAQRRKDTRDIFTPVRFQVSYSLPDGEPPKHAGKRFAALRPVLQKVAGSRNTVSNQTLFARRCFLANCSTDVRLGATLVLPRSGGGGGSYFALGAGQSVMLNTILAVAGDDAFLPRLTLRFHRDLHYVKVVDNVRERQSDREDKVVSCDVTEEANGTEVSCGFSGHILPSGSQVNVSFLLDVDRHAAPGNLLVLANVSSHNPESSEYLHDNSVSLLLPLKYGIDVNVHGFVTPTSFVFGDEDAKPVQCYSQTFNYTYKVVNSGPSKSVDTLLEITLPKLLTPYPHRLLQVVDWQSSQGACSVSQATVPVSDDCDVPRASFIKQIIFFFSSTSTRNMFCGRGDPLCEHLLCHLGPLEAGRDATVELRVQLNPDVLLQAPGRQGVVKLESRALISSPRNDQHTVLERERRPVAQVLLEGHYSQKPSVPIKVLIIVLSLLVGLMILAALIWGLWKAGFFKRHSQKEEEELKRDSWDYVPKRSNRESRA